MLLKIQQMTPPQPELYKESREYLVRQQRIDTILVLSKLLEPGNEANVLLRKKAENKIDSLIDELSNK